MKRNCFANSSWTVLYRNGKNNSSKGNSCFLEIHISKRNCSSYNFCSVLYKNDKKSCSYEKEKPERNKSSSNNSFLWILSLHLRYSSRSCISKKNRSCCWACKFLLKPCQRIQNLTGRILSFSLLKSARRKNSNSSILMKRRSSLMGIF